MEAVDLAYIAGIMDGEGCIRINKHPSKTHNSQHQYQMTIAITNTNEWLIQWLKLNFGGYTYKIKPMENRKPIFQWQISSVKAEEFLQLVLPYLKIK